MKKEGLITREFVNTFIVERKRDIHKGDCGRVLILAGSEGMAGAAILSATGAMRAGSGIVKVAIDKSLFDILQIGIPEAICIPRNSSIFKTDEFKAILIGPGLGDDDIENFVKELFLNFKGTVVFDADGLKILLKLKDFALKAKCSLIITPHPGEAGMLLSCSAEEINENRETSAIMLVQKFGATAVLKGHRTIVATLAGDTYINTTGNPGMATAGSGDVLAGVIVSLGGQGLDASTAAACGVYIHGRAGDIGAAKYGEYGLIATDIAKSVAYAMKEFERFDI